MDCKLTSAFNYSVERMLGAMAGSTCRPSVKPELGQGEALAGIVYLRGSFEGRVQLCFPLPTARKIVSEILGVPPEKLISGMVRDGVAEMTNIVAGNAKALLADTRQSFNISLPSVSSCREHDVPAVNSENSWVRHYSSIFGQFALSLRVLAVTERAGAPMR